MHPFNDPDIFTGQGTIALEMLADAPDLDVLLVPIGGGGLIAGMALAARHIKPSIRIIGVEAGDVSFVHGEARACTRRRAGKPSPKALR